jgi:MSHA pilin protein MshC
MSNMEYRFHREDRQDGFTTFEVIAVIPVIAIVGVVASSRIASKTYYDIAAETQILKANVRYAQFRALSDADADYGVNNATWGISLSGKSYTLQKNGVAATINFPGESSPTHNLPSGTSITTGAGTIIRYNVWGVPVDAANVPLAGDATIGISDGVSTQTVTVTRITGFIP